MSDAENKIPNLTNLTQLSHHNYESWRDEIRPVLRSVDAYNIVIGNELYPIGNGNAVLKQQRSFEQRSGKGAHAILSSCTPDIKASIKHLDSPQEMWDTLRTLLNNQESQAARTTIRYRFDSCRLNDKEKATEYFTRLRALRQQLAGSTDAIDDQTFRAHIYKTLKVVPKFRTIITILQAMTPAPPPEQVMRTIRTDEEETDVSELTEAANAATTADGLYTHGNSGRGGRGRGGRGRGRGRRGNGRKYNCTHCRMDNHTTEDCRRLKHKRSGNGNDANTKNEKTCFHCGLPGHFKAECEHWLRAKEQRSKVRKSGTAAKTEQAMIATAGDRDLF
jgi:hypothetical protein